MMATQWKIGNAQVEAMHGQMPEEAAPRAAAAPSGSCAYTDLTAQRAAGSIKVAVVGAGFLGKYGRLCSFGVNNDERACKLTCIAIDLSLLGVQVVVCDTNQQTAEALSSFAYELLHPLLYLGYVTKSMVTQACSNIEIAGGLEQCRDATVVIEAIPEDLEAKVNLLRSLEKLCSTSTILATSTIGLSVDAIQLQLQQPERFLGVRFFHPCVLLQPVEVTVGSATAQDTVSRVVGLLRSLEKLPHRGPTKRVLSNKEVSALQFDTAVRGNFYHGLLEPQRLASVADIIVPCPGPPLDSTDVAADTTAL